MFHFKKFSIDDSLSALKTGTDSVLLGSWTETGGAERVLDIGTGSGLLALMMAQRLPAAQIDAIEISADEAEVAQRNALMSPWSSRINVVCDSFQHFASVSLKKYDLVISNPPFFSNALRSPHAARNFARHDHMLPAGELFAGIAAILASSGRISLVFPFDAEKRMISAAANSGIFPNRITRVSSKPSLPPHRILALMSANKTAQCIEDDFIIYTENGKRSHAYSTLAHEFYLDALV